MRNFIKTVIPKEDYQQLKQVGNQWVVHLEDTLQGDMVECYECITQEEPNLKELKQELTEYLAHVKQRQLNRAISQKILELENYDKSSEVNSFELDGKSIWLDAATRQQLRISLDAYKAQNIEIVTKWFNGVKYEFPLDTWYQMLNAVEVYASEALNTTEYHKNQINSLETIQEVIDYDYTTSYPQKLIF